MKKKLSLSLVLMLIILAVMGTAYALFSSQVAEFFGRHWNKELGEWLEGGRIAKIGETFTLGGVDFTLDEVVYRDLSIFGVGTARVRDERDVLLPMDLADGWELEEAMQANEAQALLQKAAAGGGRLLSIDYTPEKIGVDSGAMVHAGDIGLYDYLNEDGSLTFSFETGGYALEDGTVYQLELFIDVDVWTESGKSEAYDVQPQRWIVSFEPVVEDEKQERRTGIAPEAVQQDGYEILVPLSYQETGTMPLYRAEENDFSKVIKTEWFNQSGIEKWCSEQYVKFRDHAELSWSPEGIWYVEYTDELFDYNSREREEYGRDIEPALGPRMALSMSIAQLASGVYVGHAAYEEDVTFEHDHLTDISLEEALQTAEDLFEKLGLEGYELAWKLDMSLDRIRTLGEAYNHEMYEGDGYSNAPRQDYASATVADEGYYLVYTPLGVPHITDSRHELTLYITDRGVVFANLRCAYLREEQVSLPEKLIAPEDAVLSLYEEAAASRYSKGVKSIERVALTYVAVRAENKQEGMVFAPVWQILYREEGSEYTSWAEFNAVNGALIDAVFR
ncbi:MAG: hypothetical protein IJ174_08325 [Clostridia bacterium]|nr:hypothetical protein [Clostridia bacterium]